MTGEWLAIAGRYDISLSNGWRVTCIFIKVSTNHNCWEWFRTVFSGQTPMLDQIGYWRLPTDTFTLDRRKSWLLRFDVSLLKVFVGAAPQECWLIREVFSPDLLMDDPSQFPQFFPASGCCWLKHCGWRLELLIICHSDNWCNRNIEVTTNPFPRPVI